MIWRTATANRRHVVFAFGENYKNSGSSIMRGLQLSNAINTSTNFSAEYLDVRAEHKNKIIFLTKGALQSSTTAELKKLRRKNTLLFDPVDSNIEEEKIKYADYIIAASDAALRHYATLVDEKKVYLLDHHVDPRINNLKFNKLKAPKIAYFGEAINMHSTDNISKLVDQVKVNTKNSSSEWIKLLKKYNAHYAIRSPDSQYEGFKPFLKGITAAHCNSIVIAHTDEDDAVRWLGVDYPYLVSSFNESEIISILDKVNYGYLNNDWQNATAIMNRVKKQTNITSIVGKFEIFLDKIES